MTLTSDILNKVRRALRNNQGTHFTAEEIRHLVRMGLLHQLAIAEANEIVAGLDERFPVDQPSPASNPAPTEMPRNFSVKTLAERWDCSDGLVRKLIASGELRSFRYGNMIRISRDAVLEREAVR